MILVQTPYGKSVSQTGVGAVPPYLVHRGYLGVIVDVAGTGGSEGQSMLFGEQEAKDGAELVEWAADLPGSNGNVGTLGGSYLGIDQVFTAAAVGPDSPLKAIFPIVTASDPYRDLFVAGGIVNMESSLGLIAGYFGLRTFTPPAERPTDLMDAIRLMIEHGLAGIPFELTTGLDALFQQGRVYDGPYWQERAPQRVLQQVVDNGVPAYIVGGQYDVFQRGEPLLYSGLQNAFSGRSVWEPMAPGQAATPRYQLLTGPWDHGNAGPGMDLDRIQLQWFDHWLKGLDTGIVDTTTPLHVVDTAGGAYDLTGYPDASVTPTAYHLQPKSGLAPALPTNTTGAATVAWKGISLSCQRSLNQWGAGIFRDAYEACRQIRPALDAAARRRPLRHGPADRADEARRTGRPAPAGDLHAAGGDVRGRRSRTSRPTARSSTSPPARCSARRAPSTRPRAGPASTASTSCPTTRTPRRRSSGSCPAR